jgi:hypothetical protein
MLSYEITLKLTFLQLFFFKRNAAIVEALKKLLKDKNRRFFVNRRFRVFYIAFSMSHTNALRPSFGVSASMSCSMPSTMSTRSSSTMVRIDDASDGQACEP